MYQTEIKINTKFINRLYNFSLYNYNKIKTAKSQVTEKFCIRIAGESMINAGITPGSVVEVTKNITPYHNDIVLARINGVHTIKRLQISNDHTYTLLAENKSFEPIVIDENMDFTIEGVITNIFSSEY